MYELSQGTTARGGGHRLAAVGVFVAVPLIFGAFHLVTAVAQGEDCSISPIRTPWQQTVEPLAALDNELMRWHRGPGHHTNLTHVDDQEYVLSVLSSSEEPLATIHVGRIASDAWVPLTENTCDD